MTLNEFRQITNNVNNFYVDQLYKVFRHIN